MFPPAVRLPPARVRRSVSVSLPDAVAKWLFAGDFELQSAPCRSPAQAARSAWTNVIRIARRSREYTRTSPPDRNQPASHGTPHRRHLRL